MGTNNQEPWTVLKLLNWTKDHFAQVGLDSPRLTAEVLLAHVLNCRRAAAHEPAAYLVGYKEFYSLRLAVTPDVLVPRSETELIVTQAAAHLRRLGRDGALWDACTGSGCIAVAVASQVDNVRVLATDVWPAAVAVAERNAAEHGLAGRLRCMEADLLTRPEADGLPERFDVITVNPPYVAAGDEVSPAVRHEPATALYAGPDGLDAIRKIVVQAPDVLATGGALIMEFGHTQADAVRDLIADSGAFAEPKILRDHQNIERTAVAVRR